MKKTYKLEAKIQRKRNKQTFQDSQTIKGDAHTIEELLVKGTQGIMPQIERQNKFLTETEHKLIGELFKPDVDLTDKAAVTNRINKLHRVIHERDEQAKKLKAEELQNKVVNTRIDEMIKDGKLQKPTPKQTEQD